MVIHHGVNTFSASVFPIKVRVKTSRPKSILIGFDTLRLVEIVKIRTGQAYDEQVSAGVP